MKKKPIASLIGLLATCSAFAAETNIQTDDVVVTATRFPRSDTETTYASELHTRKMIEASGASTLYEYLSRQTSVNVQANFGNKLTPAIDIRGYGVESGYQNVVVTVDGQRLNNIDSVPQLLGAIPLGNIDRIEITKGSGSVLYGDGATGGTIQIYTKPKSGISLNASAGNFGAISRSVSAGVAEKYFELFAVASEDSNDGYSKKDSTGKRDETTSTSQRIQLKLKPTDYLRFNLEGGASRSDTRYVNPLTIAQFKADHRQNGGAAPYTHQGLDTDTWRIGTEYDISDKWKITANHIDERKLSDFITFNNQLNYKYQSNDIALSYQGDALSTIVGMQKFDGVRDAAANFFGPANKTSKDNTGYFAQAEYRFDAFTVSAGARREKVEYAYNPSNSATLKDEQKLDAWDLGVNYRFNQAFSTFANHNQAFQAPDVDRFFMANPLVFGGPSIFNGFIKPAKSNTTNIGFNHVVSNNRLKATLFYADVDNEIYFNPFTFANTNLDQTHKYGFEIQDHWQITDKLSSAIIYTHTRAVIDKDTSGAGANGQEVPGVPKHTANANLNYKPWENTNINISHSWRSQAYAIGDFNNSLPEKQADFHSTNAAFSYQYKNLQWFASVSNIFEHKNGLYIRDDFPTANQVSVYPVDFSRTWRVGMKADF